MGKASRDAVAVPVQHDQLLAAFQNFFPRYIKLVVALGSVANRVILPALNRREVCGKAESDHQKAKHPYKRDCRIPEWHGWHAARRGLGSNLYRLGVPDMVIQRILRHANVSTTAPSKSNTVADDVRQAMTRLRNLIAASGETHADDSSHSGAPVDPHDSVSQLPKRQSSY